MLADINLLPQKEKKSKAVYLILGIVVLFTILAAVFFLLLMKDKEQQLTNIDNQITQTNMILEAERKKLDSLEASNSVNELEEAIAWAEKQPFNTVYVLQELTRLLPKRGFITEFDMDRENKIEQTVQFDTKSEAAYYLNSLLTLEWIDEAVIIEAKKKYILKEKKEKEMKNDDVLLRYDAKYEIIMNAEKLKASNHQQVENDESEGSGEKENAVQAEEEGGTSP